MKSQYELYRSVEYKLKKWRPRYYIIPWILILFGIGMAVVYARMGEYTATVGFAAFVVFALDQFINYKNIWQHGYRKGVRDAYKEHRKVTGECHRDGCNEDGEWAFEDESRTRTVLCESHAEERCPSLLDGLDKQGD